jgi:hypothetical protein
VFFAVTGGTGVYEGASGQAEHIDTDVTEIIISLNAAGDVGRTRDRRGRPELRGA